MQQISLGAAAGSALLLIAALLFQYAGGLAPCPMCIWQRWPHGVAILAGIGMLVLPMRAWALLGAGAMAVNAGLGGYHTGVERGWWPGPDSCTAPDLGAMDAGALVDQLLATEVVLCDEVAWQMFGLSMASWNALASLALALLWLRAYASSSASQ